MKIAFVGISENRSNFLDGKIGILKQNQRIFHPAVEQMPGKSFSGSLFQKS